MSDCSVQKRKKNRKTHTSGRAEASERKFTAATSAEAHWLRGSTAAPHWLTENQNKPVSPAPELTRDLTVQSSQSNAPPTPPPPPSHHHPHSPPLSIGRGRKRRRVDWITAQHLSSAATLRQNCELQLISVFI